MLHMATCSLSAELGTIAHLSNEEPRLKMRLTCDPNPPVSHHPPEPNGNWSGLCLIHHSGELVTMTTGHDVVIFGKWS